MSHRMQITLSDSQYRTLRRRSERTGSSIAELVRRSIDERYGRELTPEERRRRIQETAGLWADRGEEVYEWWRELRRDRYPRDDE